MLTLEKIRKFRSTGAVSTGAFSRGARVRAIVVSLVAGSLLGLWGTGNSLRAEGTSVLKLGVGVYPNMLHQAENSLFFYLRDVNRRMTRLQSAYRDYYGDRVQVKNIRTGGEALTGLPVDINYRYYWRGFFFSFGAAYINGLADAKSYTLVTRPGVDTAAGKTENFYEDYAKNNDADLENEVNLAKGLIRTDGKPVTYHMYVTGRSYEIPLIMGVSVFANESSNFYIGLGAVYIYGEFMRSIYNEGPDGQAWQGDNNKPDIDKFSGSGMGFQFLFGAEKKINRRFGYVFEVAMNFGAVMPLQDQIKTDSGTNTSLFHSNGVEDLGGSEEIGTLTRPGFPKLSGLLLTGYRLSFGLTYYLNYDPEYGQELDWGRDDKRGRRRGKKSGTKPELPSIPKSKDGAANNADEKEKGGPAPPSLP